jgi:Skp family chaperone for outer membrane proteins
VTLVINLNIRITTKPSGKVLTQMQISTQIATKSETLDNGLASRDAPRMKKLQIDFSEYKKSLKNFSQELNTKKIKSNSLVMDGLQPILLDYAKNNSISIILDKKNVIIAQSDLDITDTIIKNLNTKMKDVSF